MKKFYINAIFILTLLCCQNLFASSCGEKFVPHFVEYSRSEAVFIGKIKSIKSIKNPAEREGWQESWRSVEFEVLKIYKGFDSSTKKISLKNSLLTGSEADELRKNKTWIIFAKNYLGILNFSTSCSQTEEIKNDSDITELEKEIFSVKDKQAVVGRLYNDMTSDFIKDIEVILEGNGIKVVVQTDEKGMYYFPVNQVGKYKVKINLPFYALYSSYNFDVETIYFGEDKEYDLPPLKTTFIYEVELKENEFPYETFCTFVMPKKQNDKR